MLTKKQISALVYVARYHIYNAIWSAIAGEELQYARSWECEGWIYNLCFTRFKCSGALTSNDF